MILRQKALVISFSTTLLIGGCAISPYERDVNDVCDRNLSAVNEIAVYYRDERMKQIGVGALSGAALAAASAALASGGNTTAIAIAAGGGLLAGGFAADAYWKNKMATVNQNVDSAAGLVATDMQEDIKRITALDDEIVALTACRINERDSIRKRFAEGKISRDQAQQEWKQWAARVQADQTLMTFVREALVNIEKIGQSYDSALTSIQAPEQITDEMKQQWAAELKEEEKREMDAQKIAYEKEKQEIQAQQLKAKEKSKLLRKKRSEHNTKTNNIKSKYKKDRKLLAANKPPVNTKAHNQVHGLHSSYRHKLDALHKTIEGPKQLAVEANDENGFEKMSKNEFEINTGSMCAYSVFGPYYSIETTNIVSRYSPSLYGEKFIFS